MSVSIVLFFATATSVFAASAGGQAGRYGLHDPLGGQDVPTLIGSFIRFALGIVGALFLLMFVYGGIMWMIAGGDSERLKKAKHTLVNAVLGMVIIMTSYAIVSTIITFAGRVQSG